MRWLPVTTSSAGRGENVYSSRLTAKDFDPKLLELYDFYDHGKITKREFLDGAAKFAVAGMTATTILGLMSPNYALAEQVLGFKHQVQRLI